MKLTQIPPHEIVRLGLDNFMFGGLSTSELMAHCPSARIIQAQPGEHIISQNIPCTSVYLILHGQVKMTRVNVNGQELTTDIRYRADFFGRALFNEPIYITDENATAISDCCILKSKLAEFNYLLTQNSNLCLEVIRLLSKRETSLKVKFQYASHESVQVRLAHTLRELSGGFEEKCEHGYGRHIKITQQELADMVGASRPTISTLLNQLRSSGVLNYSRQYLCVQSVNAVLKLLDAYDN